MNIRRKDNDILISPDSLVTVKIMGNITEVRYMTYKPNACPIEKIDASHYVDKKTGEIKEFKQSESRIDDTASVAQSLKRLRDLINTNITNPNNALWITLTYAENMTDTERLYKDFHSFWKRFLYYLKKHNYRKADYIAVAEPQRRQACTCIIFSYSRIKLRLSQTVIWKPCRMYYDKAESDDTINQKSSHHSK